MRNGWRERISDFTFEERIRFMLKYAYYMKRRRERKMLNKKPRKQDIIPQDAIMFGVCHICRESHECKFSECRTGKGGFGDQTILYYECPTCKSKSLPQSLLKSDKSGTAVIMARKRIKSNE